MQVATSDVYLSSVKPIQTQFQNP